MAEIKDRAKYRIGITRTDLLCPGTQDYYVIEEKRGDRWGHVLHHPSQNGIVMPFPMWHYREACETFIEILDYEEKHSE